MTNPKHELTARQVVEVCDLYDEKILSRDGLNNASDSAMIKLLSAKTVEDVWDAADAFEEVETRYSHIVERLRNFEVTK